jgi:hypothetical protein
MPKRVQPDQIAEFVKLRQQGWDREPAARKVGASKSWAVRFEKGHDNDGVSYRTFREERDIPEVQKPDELSADAQRALVDFEFFRRFYLGHVSTPWQIETAEILVKLRDTPDKEFVVMNMPPGTGKALALDTPLATPGGWTTMGDVEVGDSLLDETGRPCRVVMKSPVFYGHECYKVSTDDGASVVADADHLWQVRLDGYVGTGKAHYKGKTGPKPGVLGGRSIHTTEHLAGRGGKRAQLQVAASLTLPRRDLPVDPYVLGVWLGDGASAGGRVYAHPDDAKWIRRFIEDAGFITTDHRHPQNFGVLGLQVKLRPMGLLKNKHIPHDYLWASVEQRLALLQGLIDTDGYVAPDGQIEFTSTLLCLAEGVRHLATSLGVKAAIAESRATLDGRDCGPKWRVSFRMAGAARLPRKAERTRDGVRTPSRYLSFKPVESVPTQCVAVDSPSHLYLAGRGLMVTHNTTMVHDLACWFTVRDRGIRGLIGTRKANNGERMLRRIRRTLERPQPVKAASEDIALGLAVDAEASLAMHFGRFKPTNGDVWRGAEFIVEQLDDVPIEEKEPTWSSYGVDSGVLGNRFELIFWDDLVDRTNTRTIETRQSLEDLWDSELETRLEPGGLLVLLGQRLSGGDLYSFCRNKAIDQEEEDEETDAGTTSTGLMYHRIVYPAHDEGICNEVHGRAEAKPWPEGCLLDPHRLPWRDLRRIRSINRSAYEVSYQQRDVDPEGVLVNPIWVKGGRGADGTEYPGCWDAERGYLERPLVGDNPLSVVSIDPSPTKWWATTWWAVNATGKPETVFRYLMDLNRQKMTAPDMLYAEPVGSGEYRFSGMLEAWRFRAQELGLPLTHVIIEENAAQRFFTQQPYFRQWCAQHHVTFRPHATHRNKNDPTYGVGSMATVWKYGLVRLPGKAPGGHTGGVANAGRTMALKLVDEVQKWPGGSTDDCVMSSWFFELALPQIAVIDASKIPRLKRPSWMIEVA